MISFTNNYSFLSTIKKYTNASVVLILFTILALVCANIPKINTLYFSLWQNPVSFSIGSFNFFKHGNHILTLGQVINDFLMAIFFLSVGLEIKREILVGELSSRDKALLPIIGACGGMIIPVLLFWILCPNNPEMMRGIAIPMATDIAFSLGVLTAFKSRVPIGLKVFLAALAVADDLGGIIVIALFYTSNINFTFMFFAGICVLIMIIANIMKCHSKNLYIIVGLFLWYTMLNSGIHATIAGVITAFCIPATIKKGTGHYLERIRENIGKFPVIDVGDRSNTIVLTNEQIHTLKSIESAADKMISQLQDLEDKLSKEISFFIIPILAIAKAGIDVSQMSTGDLFSGIGLCVMLALVLGKFIGVFTFSFIAIKFKIVQLPANTTWSAFASVCVICGIGFTVSMFIADLSYAGLGASGAP